MRSRGRNKPILRFLKFNEPWVDISLGEVGSFKNGLNKAAEDFGFGYPFVNLMDVFGKPALLAQEFGLVNSSAKDREIYNLKKGDVLFIRSSVKREGVGETSVLLNDLKDTVYSGFLIRFREETPVLDLNFKRYCFHTRRFRNHIISVSTSSANTNINQESLSNLSLAVPSVEEQQKIAAFLSAIDEKIVQLARKKELLVKYKKGVMQQIFDQKIRFKDDNGNDFREWKTRRLGDVCEMNPASAGLPELFFYIDLESVESGKLNKETALRRDEAPSRAQRVLKKGDILFQMVRPYQRNNLIFDRDGIFVASTGYAQIRPQINTNFLFQLLLTSSFVKKVVRRCTGTSYPAINSDDLSQIKIDIPSRKEQEKIGGFLHALDQTIDLVEQQLQGVKAFKKGLLQQMFV